MTTHPHQEPARVTDLSQFEGHTPGPWETSIMGNIWTVDSPKECVAQYIDPRDAHLIAAAPDLVRELREARAMIGTMNDALVKIEAALRKDSRQKTICGDDVEYHLDGQAMYQAINAARDAVAAARLLTGEPR